MSKSTDDQYSEADTVRRRELALKRMLSTPHQPHKPFGKRKPKRKLRSPSSK